MSKNFDLNSYLQFYGDKYDHVVLLESQKKDHPSSNKSYLATAPSFWFEYSNGVVTEYENGEISTFEQNIWDYLADVRSRFNDWMFGYLGYDLKNDIENLNSRNQELLDVPDCFFMIPEILIEFDSFGNSTAIKGNDEWISTDTEEYPVELTPLAFTEKSDYVEMIYSAQNKIREGDFYEINISHPLLFKMKGAPLDLYARMKKAGPVPFAGFLQINDFSICCQSPERFLGKLNNRVYSQPIKGTVSREGSESYNEELIKLQSDKNRAENLMIVDLVRNDLNKIALNGSVTVEQLFEVQSFETVHQMVSTIACKVDEHCDPVSILKECFPMGSMTGAPKIASMQTIEEIENYRRGVYSGAIGYFSPEGDFDFNVVIRSALIKGEKLVYPVGGAITSDSDPDDEWDETLAKAKALLKAVSFSHKYE